VTVSSTRWRRTRGPRDSRVNQATRITASTHRGPEGLQQEGLARARRSADHQVLAAVHPLQGAQRRLGADRAGGHVLAAGEAELTSLALMVGLAPLQGHAQAVRGLGDILGIEGDQLGATQAPGEAEDEQGARSRRARERVGPVLRKVTQAAN
jgi:hypothetical protein